VKLFGKNFSDLITEHPDLPVICSVASEVVPENDYRYWYGEAASVAIDKYLCMVDGTIYLYSDIKGDELDFAENQMMPEDFEMMREDQIIDWVNNLPWKEAVIITVEPAEDL